MATRDGVRVTSALRKFRKRGGLTIQQMAKAVGFRNGSSYQHYESPRLFKRKYLPLEVAERFADALEGRGDPPIQRSEIYALAGLDDAEIAARVVVSLDELLMQGVIATTEQYLTKRKLTLPPDKKAKLVLHLYRTAREKYERTGRGSKPKLEKLLKVRDINALVELVSTAEQN